MKKERIKDILLVALVLCSLVLTGKIWLNEKLWPDGIFLDRLQSKLAALFSPDSEDENTNILYPANMIAYTVKNSDHASFNVTKTNEHYDAVRTFCDSAIEDALGQPQKNIFVTDENAWKNALFTNGMYLDFGSDIPSSVFCALSGASAQADIVNATENIRYVIITSEGNLVSSISVYLRDSQGNCLKIETAQTKTALTDILNSLKDYVTPNNRFSFFIGADTATSGMGEVLFDPYLLLTENELQTTAIRAQNPLYDDTATEIKQGQTERLLRCFSMNPKTAKKYTDADENIIFLQNRSTLKISKSGHIEYTAAAGENGFKLSDNANPDSVALARTAVRLVYDVYGVFTDTHPQLYMSDFTANETQTDIHLDYNINGVRILNDLSGGHAASVQTKNGYVQKFSLHVRAYTDTQTQVTLPSSYTAVDRIFATIETANDNTVIENMFIGYYDDGTDTEKQPIWFIKLEDDEQLKIQK